MRMLSTLELDLVGAGKYVTPADFNIVNASTQDLNNLSLALTYLQNSTVGSNVLNEAIGSTINIIHNGADGAHPETDSVDWDPTSGLLLSDGDIQSAALGLLHEFGHLTEPGGADESPDPQYGDVGDRIVIENVEDPAAQELGEPERFDHSGDAVTMPDSESSYEGGTADNGNGEEYWDGGDYSNQQTLYRTGSFS